MKNYTSIKHNHRYKMIERDFIESAIVNTPELSYKYQIYILKMGIR